MGSDQNDKSDLVSLKELKDITNQASEQPKTQAAKPKERRTSSFIDDADSLLADIRSEVEDVVTTGAAALKDRKTANLEALELQRREQELRKQEEIEAQLAAEAARRKVAAEEREQQRRTLSGIVEDEPEATAAQAAEHAEPVASPQPKPVAAPIEPPRRKGPGFYAAIIGLPLLIVSAAVVYMGGDESPKSDITQPSKAAKKATIGNAPATDPASTKPVVMPKSEPPAAKKVEASTITKTADEQSETTATKKPKADSKSKPKSATTNRAKSRTSASARARARARKLAIRKAKARKAAKSKKKSKPKKKRDQLKLNLGGF